MSNEPIETTIVTPEPSRALVVRQNSEIGILRPAGSLDAIADAFKEYQAVCERILTKDDYQLYEKKPRKKKSAWRKLATAFNVSTEKVDEDIQRQDGHVVSARYTIRAFTPTRRMEAEGFCEVHEKCCPSARGDKCHKAAWKGHHCCQNGCDGRKHWSHADHDVISTGQTRATNRAIADLIGCGEVSAEELVDDEPRVVSEHPHKPEPAPAPPTPLTPKPAKIPKPLKPATARTRDWMILELGKFYTVRQIKEYFTAIEWLLPDVEDLGMIELRYVANTDSKLKMLITRIEQFLRGDKAEPAYAPDWEGTMTPEQLKAFEQGQTDEPKPSPKPKTAESEDDLPMGDERPALRGKIETTSLKEGKSKKGPWSLWGIKIEGEWVNTFSNTIGQSAQKNKGNDVTLFYEMDGDRKKAVELVLADGTSIKSE